MHVFSLTLNQICFLKDVCCFYSAVTQQLIWLSRHAQLIYQIIKIFINDYIIENIKVANNNDISIQQISDLSPVPICVYSEVPPMSQVLTPKQVRCGETVALIPKDGQVLLDIREGKMELDSLLVLLEVTMPFVQYNI